MIDKKNGLKLLDSLLIERLSNNDEYSGTNNQIFNPFFVSSDKVKDMLSSDFDDPLLWSEEYSQNIELLSACFGLKEVEKDALLLMFAPEINPKYERIYSYIQDDLNKKFPTISLFSSLLAGSDLNDDSKIPEYFDEDFTLRKYRLIRFVDASNQNSFYNRQIRLDHSILKYILGQPSLDGSIRSFSRLITRANKDRANPENLELADKISKELDNRKSFILHFHGRSDMDKKLAAVEIASELGWNILEVNAALAPSGFIFDEDILNVIFRDALITGSLVLIDNYDSVIKEDNYPLSEKELFRRLDDFSWLTFISTTKRWIPKAIPRNHIIWNRHFKSPEKKELIRLWKEHLNDFEGNLGNGISMKLSNLFKFTNDEISGVVHLLKSRKIAGETINEKVIYEACRERVSARFDHLAQRMKMPYGLDDIVLPDSQRELLKDVISYFKHQSRVFESWGFKKFFMSQGLSVLFTGPPGTGKTMAAGIIANQMGLDIYRTDLSHIVSKYIGETEKNLSKVFEAADGAGVILFFDEADALFGKRTDIKDAHDRYANIEVSYLLQQIEESDFPIILASNFRNNLDDAFIRRLRFIIDFPFPSEELRKKIWFKIFPESSPLAEDIDVDLIANNFKLSGANIRNAALSSAFFAAEKADEIKMKFVVKGIKRELLKMGKSYKTSDFGPYDS